MKNCQNLAGMIRVKIHYKACMLCMLKVSKEVQNGLTHLCS